MPEPSTLALFAAVALAILLTPGPAVMYIVATSLAHGRIAGFASVLGLVAGGFVHLFAALAGLSAVLSASPLAFVVLKYAGAAYLVFLGYRLLRSANPPAGNAGATEMSLAQIFVNGVVVNLTNPKAALFFLALLPQFVDPSRGPAWVQGLALGVIFLTIALLTDTLYALGAGAIGARLRRDPGVGRLTRRMSGAVYIGLGVAAALMERPL